MTPATSTITQLYAAVLDSPYEDTPRLMYADELDACEPVRVTCPRCMGTGSHGLDPYDLASRYGTHRAGMMLDAAQCGVCNGTGDIIDPTNAQRSELIRVSVALDAALRAFGNGWSRERLPSADMYLDPEDADNQRWKHDVLGIWKRERELLAIAKQWERLPCVACRGTGRRHNKPYNGICPVCHDQGDLLQLHQPLPHVRTVCTVTWERGFPVVSAATAEVWREEQHHMTGVPARYTDRTIPTPWAKAIAGWAVGIWLTDWVPVAVGSRWCITSENNGRTLPRPVADQMYRGPIPAAHPTREAAEMALAYAAAKWARNHVSYEEFTRQQHADIAAALGLPPWLI